MIDVFTKIDRPSLRYGIFFGLLLGAVQIAYGVVTGWLVQADLQTLLATIGEAFFPLFGFFAGQRAAQATGKLGSGVLAGLWAGLIGAILFRVAPLIDKLTNLDDFVINAQLYIQTHQNEFPGRKASDYTTGDALTGILLEVLFFVSLYALLTLIGGALGGLRGRKLAEATSANEEPEEEVFTPSRPQETARVADTLESAE